MSIFGHYLPGQTPIPDKSLLLVTGISTLAELNVHEANNIRRAVVKYLAAKPSRRTAPFDLNWLLKLHDEMFGAVWAYAGRIRQSNLNLGIAWQHVTVQLQEMLDDLRYWETHWPDVIEQAAHLHHRAVVIHPFLGGNGRWSRLLASIWLKQHGLSPTIWPEDTIGAASSIRQEYLDALRQADAGNMAPLVELHRRYSPSA
jgi:Fic-DOC domain mobile mystery protein B